MWGSSRTALFRCSSRAASLPTAGRHAHQKQSDRSSSRKGWQQCASAAPWAMAASGGLRQAVSCTAAAAHASTRLSARTAAALPIKAVAASRKALMALRCGGAPASSRAPGSATSPGQECCRGWRGCRQGVGGGPLQGNWDALINATKAWRSGCGRADRAGAGAAGGVQLASARADAERSICLPGARIQDGAPTLAAGGGRDPMQVTGGLQAGWPMCLFT